MFTEFDVLVTVIITAFTLIAFMRGFVKDLLSFASWFGAAILTVYFYPFAASHIDSLFKSPIAVSIAASASIYISSMIVFTIISTIILKSMGEHRKGAVDRSLGVVFGLLKGVFLVSLIHYCIVLVAEKEPEWLKEGETYKITRSGYEFLEEHTGDSISKLVKQTKKQIDEAVKDPENLEKIKELNGLIEDDFGNIIE